MKRQVVIKWIFIAISILLLYIAFLFVGPKKQSMVEKRYKYKIAVISVFKNETMNLAIWIDHYIKQGVSQFYLTDNGSTDNPLDILQPYIDNGLVSYTYDATKHNQTGLIRHMVEKYDIKNNVEWLINCDIDEFFFGLEAPLVDIIDQYDKYDSVKSQWYMFGSNGKDKHPDDIRLELTTRQKDLPVTTKYIFKPSILKNIEDIELHSLKGEYNNIIENDKIRIYHYPIQSREFFEKIKMSRGDASSSGYDSFRDWNYFDKYNEGTDFVDVTLRDITLKGYAK